MTDQELKDFIRQAVNEAVGQMPRTAHTPRLLEPTHTKWFRDERGNCPNSKMGIAFLRDGVRTSKVWDHVRPICTAICGKDTVRQVSIDDAEFINGVADKICQLIYDAKVEFNSRKRKEQA